MNHIAGEVEKAIAAHGMWKARLKAAIEAGKMDTPVNVIRMDNQCDFGKWLYGPTMTLADKASDHYKRVRDLHAEFHKVAARVVELAIGGQKVEAEKMMAIGGEFASISAKLTKALKEWRSASL